jgi:hypothetical protein
MKLSKRDARGKGGFNSQNASENGNIVSLIIEFTYYKLLQMGLVNN